MNDHTGDEELTPAQEALLAHLELLRAHPPSGGPDLMARILRRARWQTAIRDPLIFVGAVSAAMAEGLSLLTSASVGEP